MAQVLKFYEPAKPRQQMDCNNLALAVPNSSTQILKIPCLGMDRIFVTVGVATNALAGFNIQAQATADGPAQTLYSTAGNFTTPSGLLVGASGDLTTLAAGATGWFIMQVSGLAYVIVNATSGNVGGSTLTVYAGGA